MGVVFFQADRAEGYYSGDGDWTDCRRYYISQDSNEQEVSSQVVQQLGEVDMGDPAVLSDFLMWAHQEYPAERVALILWDHGDGWSVRAKGPPPDPISHYVSWDDSSGNYLSIAGGDLRQAVRGGEAGVVAWASFDPADSPKLIRRLIAGNTYFSHGFVAATQLGVMRSLRTRVHRSGR